MQKRNLSLVFVFILLAVSLTACTGVPLASGWPESVVDGNAIYTASGAHIYAVNAETGKELTPRRFPEKAEGNVVFASAPVLVNGDLYIGDYNSTVWNIPTNFTSEAKKKTDATGRYIASPAVVGDLILVPNADHNLYAYDKDLALKWKFSASNGIWTKPVSDGDLIYVTSMDKSVYALKENAKKDSVDVVWSKDLGGSILFSLAIGEDGNLYIGTLNNELFSIEAKSGRVNWQVKTAGTVWSPVVLKENLLFAGDQSGKIFALNTIDGKQVWEYAAGSPVVGGLALFENNLYAGTEKGEAVCLTTDEKPVTRMVWSKTVGGKLYSTPVITDKFVVFGVFESDKTLVAYGLRDDSTWTFTPSK